jgi:hypothetical protein
MTIRGCRIYVITGKIAPTILIFRNRIRFHPGKYLQSMGGNQYAKYVKELGRDEVIEMYKEYTMNELELLKLVRLELKGKRLGC